LNAFPEIREHRLDLDFDRHEALERVAEAAEIWGAHWRQEGTGGRLELPVTAGVRRGVLGGRLWFESASSGTRAVLRIEESRYSLNLSAIGVLLLGAVGGFVIMLWPFFPQLLALAPLAGVLALVAWLLVASRLRTTGAEEFLELVAELGHREIPDLPDREPEEPDRLIEP
jgi:hypothetical protein